MKAFLTLGFLALALNFAQAQTAGNSKPENEMTTYFFIRHAEKETIDPQDRDPQLSPEGLTRVQKWVDLFRETEIDMVYSTNYHRTRGTATPIAQSKGLEVQFYDPAKINDEEFQKNTQGKTVLVVGHSNTNPHFVNAILKHSKYKDLDEAEYGSLYILSQSPTGETTSQILYIN